MTRYFLYLSYDGRDFHGWQSQENTAVTVQQVMEEKLAVILKENVSLTGCGRTDTGVNARNFVAHLDSAHNNLHLSQRMVRSVNGLLPRSIAVHKIVEVRPGAHARFDASRRVYYYYLSGRRDPFRDRYCWYVHGDIDFSLMNKAAGSLLRHTDFTSFSKHGTQTKTNLCRIESARWSRSGEYEHRFAISADRFLRGMVRAIVGTMVLVGRGKISVTDFETIIAEKDRSKAGNNAPANALFLAGIGYPDNIFI